MARQQRNIPAAEAIPAQEAWAAKMARLRGRGPREDALRVPADAGAVKALEAAQEAYETARRAAPWDVPDPDAHPPVAEARRARDDAQAAVDDSMIVLSFRGLPSAEYDALLSAHPPTPEQEAAGDRYNEKTLQPALVAACSLDGMPEADAAELLSSWSKGDQQALLGVVFGINVTAQVRLGKG